MANSDPKTGGGRNGSHPPSSRNNSGPGSETRRIVMELFLQMTGLYRLKTEPRKPMSLN